MSGSARRKRQNRKKLSKLPVAFMRSQEKEIDASGAPHRDGLDHATRMLRIQTDEYRVDRRIERSRRHDRLAVDFDAKILDFKHKFVRSLLAVEIVDRAFRSADIADAAGGRIDPIEP